MRRSPSLTFGQPLEPMRGTDEKHLGDCARPRRRSAPAKDHVLQSRRKTPALPSKGHPSSDRRDHSDRLQVFSCRPSWLAAIWPLRRPSSSCRPPWLPLEKKSWFQARPDRLEGSVPASVLFDDPPQVRRQPCSHRSPPDVARLSLAPRFRHRRSHRIDRPWPR